jgi:hypothetical protein
MIMSRVRPSAKAYTNITRPRMIVKTSVAVSLENDTDRLNFVQLWERIRLTIINLVESVVAKA